MKTRALTWSLRIGGVCLILALAGFAVAASGIVPIKASAGHWAVTEWMLQFGKRRSIATHTMATEAPKLEEPWLVMKGAGHYEGGCRPCHGSPDLASPRIAAAMTPRPPALSTLVEKRKPEELFYVVKHGIKFTGMPAWPSLERDDEVRAVVAFLLELPKLDGASYRRLVDGGAAPAFEPPLDELDAPGRVPSAVLSNCARCHGVDGLGRGLAAFPKLAGQRREYLLAALRAYAENRRQSGIMGPIAASLAPETHRALADYYGSLPAEAVAAPTHDDSPRFAAPESVRGEAIARHGIPNQGVPSCMDCHGPGEHRRNPAYPNLSGQYRDFLVLQLELFRENRRGGSPYAHIMHHVTIRLKPDQMRDVASYYALLPPERAARSP